MSRKHTLISEAYAPITNTTLYIWVVVKGLNLALEGKRTVYKQRHKAVRYNYHQGLAIEVLNMYLEHIQNDYRARIHYRTDRSGITLIVEKAPLSMLVKHKEDTFIQRLTANMIANQWIAEYPERVKHSRYGEELVVVDIEGSTDDQGVFTQSVFWRTYPYRITR